MKKPCEYCGGSGQIQFFAGVSRFFLSCEECPACAGFGFELPAEANSAKKEPPRLKKKSLRKRSQ